VQRQAQQTDLVLQGQRRHGHAGLQAGHLDGARVHALGQHGQAFHHIGGEHARGVEAAAVVDHDGRLADLQHVVEAARQRLVRGLLAHDDLDQRHLVDRREEVQADEVGGRALALARPVMGSVEVLEANTASGAITASACLVQAALMARSSNTASTTRSQPCRSS
jgi:hypothetical protein